MFSTEDFQWVLGSLCQLKRIPFEAALLRQQFPPPYDQAALVAAAQAFGFRLGETSARSSNLSELPAPWLAVLRSDAGEGQDSEPCGPALIVQCSEGKIAYFCPGDDAPSVISCDEFESKFEPTALLFAHEPAPALDEDMPAARRPFGFSWFIPELIKHKRIWVEVLGASLAIQLVALATPLCTQIVIDKVVVHHTQSTLWVVGVALLMFMAFSAVMSWMRQYLVLHTGNRVDAVLGQSVFRHLFRLPMPYFEHRQTGVLVARLHGVEQIREFVSGAAVTLLLDCPFLLVFLVVMFWYSWQLSLIALAALLLIAALSIAVIPLFRDKLNKQFLLGAKNQAFVTEYLAGMATVKSLQLEPVLERRYGDQLAHYLAAGFETRQLSNTYNTVANALEQAMTLAVLVVGATLVMDSGTRAATGGPAFTIGMLVAFQMFASRMSQPMLRLVGLWQQFQQADIAVKRLGDVMDMPTEPHTLLPQRSGEAFGAAGAIEFQDVSFRYSDKHPWLYKSLRLQIRPGQLTVLMGPSGCGKSTLAKLLLGFYPPSDGRILIDSKDAGQLSANELRAAFGVVPQETTLFSGTVFENLQMANPHADFTQVVEACRMAEIHDVIEQLPQGYQTQLGEHGVGLSGGQRQRIAIARALIKKPRVLIFDEATSSLDAATAEHLAQTINQLKGRVTILLITHAMPRGLQADEVLQFGARATDASERQGPTHLSVIDEARVKS